MTNPYPPPAKRLVRSTRSRVIGGVCGGLAEYLNMDPTLVRILTVLISLFTGVPVILYIVALFVIPEDTSASSVPPPVTGAPTYPDPFSSAGPAGAPPAYAQYPTPRPAAEDAVWGSEGAPWEQRQEAPVAPPEPPTPPTTAEPPGETRQGVDDAKS